MPIRTTSRHAHLDESGATAFETQARILRVPQEGEV